jgi:hypothetical protein
MRFIIAVAIIYGAMAASDAEAQVRVRGYVKKDGTYVAPHYRSSPNRTTADNWSTYPNVNPYTGAEGQRFKPSAPDFPIEYKPIMPSVPAKPDRPRRCVYGCLPR